MDAALGPLHVLTNAADAQTEQRCARPCNQGASGLQAPGKGVAGVCVAVGVALRQVLCFLCCGTHRGWSLCTDDHPAASVGARRSASGTVADADGVAESARPPASAVPASVRTTPYVPLQHLASAHAITKRRLFCMPGTAGALHTVVPSSFSAQESETRSRASVMSVLLCTVTPLAVSSRVGGVHSVMSVSLSYTCT